MGQEEGWTWWMGQGEARGERRGQEVGRRDRVRGQREGEDNRVGGAEEGRDRVGWA